MNSLLELADKIEHDRICPRCDGDKLFGEAGWMLCRDCGWDELPARASLNTEEEL